MPERNMTPQSKAVTRHLVSINDLSNSEIECVFEVAQSFLNELADRRLKYRIGRGKRVAPDSILATLFFEPSTRTRLSFESAMLRLGGSIITSADPATSSAAKGESLADSVRVVGNYADLLVIRHPRDGAARLAAEYAKVPVINGGDGSHEHPTQTLCDLFTLRQKHKSIRNLKVAISGDLKGSRTIHSFVYALARFGATIEPLPAPGMELPLHVDRRLREEFRSKIVTRAAEEGEAPIDALYVTADEPHQQSLFSGPEIDYERVMIEKKIDAVYVTRFQKERWSEKEAPYPKIDAAFLRNAKYSEASVMHPLPRVGELDAAIDSDIRAMYFQQAAYGVPVRMALISLLLGLQPGKSLRSYESGFHKDRMPLYNQPRSSGIRCGNPNCIVHEPSESQYVRNRFHVVRVGRQCLLRCAYCETDRDEFVTANKRQMWYSHDTTLWSAVDEHAQKDMLAFATEDDARKAGFHLRKNARHGAPARKASAAS
jgi:aspartate carbamoyltransferase catalytic subunit